MSAISVIMNNYISSIVAQVTILLPNKISKCTARQEEKLCAAFSDDLEDPDALLAEMEVTCGAMEKSEAKNLHEAEGWLKDKHLFYPTLAKAYQFALIIPISVACNERSFSKLRLVKSYLRSTMKVNHLDFLMILALSPNFPDSLDIDKIADSWSTLKARRVRIWTKYFKHI